MANAYCHLNHTDSGQGTQVQMLHGKMTMIIGNAICLVDVTLM